MLRTRVASYRLVCRDRASGATDPTAEAREQPVIILDPLDATSSLPDDQARAEGVGLLLLWMIGLWTVGAGFAIRGFRP